MAAAICSLSGLQNGEPYILPFLGTTIVTTTLAAAGTFGLGMLAGLGFRGTQDRSGFFAPLTNLGHNLVASHHVNETYESLGTFRYLAWPIKQGFDYGVSFWDKLR